MSDEALSELRRRWQESGTVEDEAVWLRAALRQGELPGPVLDARAWLGDPGACFALERDPPQLELDAWVRGLAAFDVGPGLSAPQVPAEGWGHPLLVGASLAAIEAAVAPAAIPAGSQVSTARAALGAWLEAGTPADPALLALHRHLFESSEAGSPLEALCVAVALGLAQVTVQDATLHAAGVLRAWLSVNLSVAQRMVYIPGHVAAVAVSAAARGLGEEALREAVARALLELLRID